MDIIVKELEALNLILVVKGLDFIHQRQSNNASEPRGSDELEFDSLESCSLWFFYFGARPMSSSFIRISIFRVLETSCQCRSS